MAQSQALPGEGGGETVLNEGSCLDQCPQPASRTLISSPRMLTSSLLHAHLQPPHIHTPAPAHSHSNFLHTHSPSF